MLSNSAIHSINRQIERELRELNSILTSDEEKVAIIDRIAKLKELLNPHPSREDILAELAAALVDAQEEKSTRQSHDVMFDLGSVIASFYRK